MLFHCSWDNTREINRLFYLLAQEAQTLYYGQDVLVGHLVYILKVWNFSFFVKGLEMEVWSYYWNL